jgi:hypothetical protein
VRRPGGPDVDETGRSSSSRCVRRGASAPRGVGEFGVEACRGRTRPGIDRSGARIGDVPLLGELLPMRTSTIRSPRPPVTGPPVPAEADALFSSAPAPPGCRRPSPHSRGFRRGDPALARGPRPRRDGPDADHDPRPRTSWVCSTSRPCSMRGPGCGCHPRFDIDRMLRHIQDDGITTRWPSRPSHWPRRTSRAGVLRPVLAALHHVGAPLIGHPGVWPIRSPNVWCAMVSAYGPASSRSSHAVRGRGAAGHRRQAGLRCAGAHRGLR